MSNVFEELMMQNRKLSEGLSSERVMKRSSALSRRRGLRNRISESKVKVESMRIFEEESFDDLDDKFSIGPDDISSEDEVILIVDPELPSDEDVPEDAATSLIGQSIYKCPVCGSNYVGKCDVIDCDDSGVPTECPVCGDDSPQILIGEIAPKDVGSGEEVEERPSKSPDLDDEDFDEIHDLDDEDFDEIHDLDDEEDFEMFEEGRRYSRRPRQSRQTSRPTTVRKSFDESYSSRMRRPSTPTSTRRERKPFSESRQKDLYFDEKKFESLVTKILRENYQDRPVFTVDRVVGRGPQMVIEYTVRDRRESQRGQFVVENMNYRDGRSSFVAKDYGVFIGSKDRTKTSPFTIHCETVNGRITPLSIRYDFTKKVNESLYRVYGNVR